MNKSLDSIVIRYVGFGLLLLGLLVSIYLVRGALPVFVIAGVIAFAMEPVLQRMEKRGYTRSGAVGFIGVVVVLIGCILLSLVGAAFQQGQAFVRDAPTKFRTVETIVQNNRKKLNDSKLPKALKESINESIDPYLAYLGDNINKKASELAPQETPTPTATPDAESTPTASPEGEGTTTATLGVDATPTAAPQGASVVAPTPAPTITTAPTLTPTATALPQPSATTSPVKPLSQYPSTAPTTASVSGVPGAKVGEVVPVAVTMVTALGSFLAHMFLTIIVSFGLMLEAPRIKARLLMLVPPLYRRDVTDLSTSINEILGQYVRGQLIVCGTFGVLCTIAFEAISHFYGMQYPLVLGIFAGVIYVLPYVGLAIVTVAAAAIAYFTSEHQVPALIAAVCSIVVFNLSMDYYVSPRVLGKGVGLHPIMVIFALLCGFELGGPLGTVVAVPLFASLRVIAIYLFPQLAAPLPDESPQATSLDKPHGPISESGKRVADAENKARA